MRSWSISVTFLIVGASAQQARAQGFLTLPLRQTNPVIEAGWRYNSGRPHYGINYRTSLREEVIAACDGRAIATTSFSDRGPGAYGTFVLQRCNNLAPDGTNYFVIYAHLDSADTSLAQRSRFDTAYSNWTPVIRGEVLGRAGSSGMRNGYVHLHLEVFTGSYSQKAGHQVDPYGVRSVAFNYPGPCTNTLWLTCPPQPWNPPPIDADSDGYTVSEGDCMDTGMTPEGVPASAIHPGATEVCNYTDDDCDGTVDEGFPGLLTPCTVGVGACANSGVYVCTTDFMGTACSVVPYPPSPETCDGEDDDCDGSVDDGVLNACGTCGPTPAETCNGLDDDCDGAIDEGTRTCPSGMVAVNLCFCMDAYEASRPDATTDNDAWPGYGVPDDGVPQSIAGVMPWQMVTWGGAAAACVRAGKRLCLASEWDTACEGALGWDYPYGESYDSAICNGWEDTITYGSPTGSFTECVTPSGIFDLSGNVWEWVEHDLLDSTDMGRRGGSYIDDSNVFLFSCIVVPFPVTDPDCASETVVLDTITGFPTCGHVASNVGFRCCFGP